MAIVIRTLQRKSALRNGFTLIELLVALGILALIISIGSGGLKIGLRSWEVSRRDEIRGEIEAIVRALSELIANAQGVLESSGTAPRLAFHGSGDSIRFISLSEGEVQKGGFFIVDLGTISAGATNVLSLWTSEFGSQRSWAQGRQGMRRTEVASGAIRLEISYFGPEIEKGRAEWRSQWIDINRLPLLVRLRITWEKGKRKVDVTRDVAVKMSH